MQAYTELLAPSAVTHSLSLPFTSATANNLIVAKGSLLQIFTTKTVQAELDHDHTQNDEKSAQHADRRLNDDDGLESSFLGGDMILVKADRSDNTKLVLVAEIPLAGTVIGLSRIKLKNTISGGEALLLAYKAAKLALTEWNPQKNILETISIHYYEKDELQGAPWELSFGDYVNCLEADPGSRCAAFKFGSRNLAILPFRQSEEDLEMEDWDEDLDGPRPVTEPAVATNGDGPDHKLEETAYRSSFVLRLPLLDPTLLHPVHLAFLHEYREPTFGILSSTQPVSASLGVKDHLSYKVFTLDLQQQASTTILSVTGLPQDLFRIMPLPAPVGGALLIGQNELIHVDQSGKPNGVAVNPLTRQSTSFSLTDQSELNLRLEGCRIEQLSLDHGELLLILNNGRLGLISFNLDGRTVSGLSVKLVPVDNGGALIKGRPSCISLVGRNALFVGSESCDSVVLGWHRKHSQDKKKKAKLVDAELGLDEDDLDLDDDEEDDDLYGDSAATVKASQVANGVRVGGEVFFRKHDSLLSIAPIKDFACGAPSFVPGSEEETLAKGVYAELELACAVGSGDASAIAVINRNVQPKVIGRFDFPEARGFWTMCVKKPLPKSLGGAAMMDDTQYDAAGLHDKFMIVAKVDLDGYETSDVYALTAAGFETLKDTEFEPAAGITVEAGTMGKRMRVIQVLKSEVRSYDGDLGLVQILPMMDEETGQEPRITSASIVDPYLLLVREDSSILIAQLDKNHELEEVDKTDGVKATKWAAGCLYSDKTGTFSTSTTDSGTENVVMFLLSANGSLHIYALPDLENPLFVADGLSFVPPYLSANYTVRRGTARDTLTELLVADLGDAVSSTPHLILRHAANDVTIYEPLRHQPEAGTTSLAETLIFKKSPNSHIAASEPERPQPEEGEEDSHEPPRSVPLRPCANIAGSSVVFLPGSSPAFITKSSKSVPRVIGLQGLPVRGMSSFHTEGCDRGFIYADSEGIARVTQLPRATNLTELGVSVKKIPMHCDIQKIAYHHPTGSYIAACHVPETFELPKDDDYHKEWIRETLSFPPTLPRGVLKLISPTTWSAINNVDMESCESIESMKTLNLEVSEETKERRLLVAVGTAITKGEDLPTRGRLQVYDIVNVIPQPGKPETNRRLKLIAEEDIPRGSVSALAEVGTQGLMLVAQGQKCMVRGLKEDGSLLPVAFLDMNTHVVSATELPGTGLCLMADAMKGVWFCGYTEEPYTFKVLGKSSGRLPLLTANFLPDGDDLSIVAVDQEGDMHIFEFNPDHPKSLQGHLLVHRTTFSLAPSAPTSSLLLPRTSPGSSQSKHSSSSSKSQILLLASPSGALSTLIPLNESTYRRLLSVTNQLLPALVPHGGLNAKAYRVPAETTNVGVDTGGGRTVVDGAVLAGWCGLGFGKRGEIAGRGGYDGVGELRGELEGVLGWGGLSYF